MTIEKDFSADELRDLCVLIQRILSDYRDPKRRIQNRLCIFQHNGQWRKHASKSDRTRTCPIDKVDRNSRRESWPWVWRIRSFSCASEGTRIPLRDSDHEVWCWRQHQYSFRGMFPYGVCAKWN